MYLDCKVAIPETGGKITKKTISGTTYIYYEYARVYSKEKKYNSPKRICVGKQVSDQPKLMIPNDKFLKTFPDVVLPEEKNGYRSGCLRIGTYIVIRKIISDYSLDLMLARIIGKDAGLFLDLAAYTIVMEDNAGQYYPDYAFNHPLLTDDMRVYSDSKVSDFLGSITVDQRIKFLNEWNAKRDHREKIYISNDATNKTSQAGDVDMVEFGHPKDDQGKPIFNFSIAYDRNNREPLFYEAYPGSIADVSQLQCTLAKAEAYGYKKVGFILDRGYFSKENIQFMDKCKYDFVLMVKGMKKLVSEIVLDVRGTFEDDRKNSIRAWIDRMAKTLKECMGLPIHPKGDFAKYFDLIFWHEGKADEKFMSGIEKDAVINEGIKLCGYFVIVTSEKMTAEEALTLYKSRDGSEKLFRGDKSYLGARAERTYSNESTDAKIFIEFVAMIIRSKMYTCLKDENEKLDYKKNFMTVPAALKELEKIEMLKGADNEYRLDYAVTKTQKTILNAFGITATNVQKQAGEIGSDLARIELEEFEKAAAKAQMA